MKSHELLRAVSPLDDTRLQQGCERNIEIIRRGEPCPGCGGYRLRVEGGNNLRIKELEVE